MKYKEFKKKIEDWGKKYNYKFVVEVDHNHVYITFKEDSCKRVICEINNLERFVVDLNFQLYRNLPENAKSDLFQIITEFVATPIEDREDEKLFYAKHKFLNLEDDWNYLNRYDDEHPFLEDKYDSLSCKTKFTLKEIEGIKKEFNTNLEDFELVEVEEVE